MKSFLQAGSSLSADRWRPVTPGQIYHERVALRVATTCGVTSSSLCKKGEGAILPLLIEAVKDGINNPFDTGDVDEQDHRPGAAPDLDEAALDGIGGAQLAPQWLG